MHLFLDTEFNGFCGDLISMALVPESPQHPYFYQSLGCAAPCEWVAANVMPIIGIDPIGREDFQIRLAQYLNQWAEVTIIADWHEDIAHFCDILTTGPGNRIPTPTLRFEIRRDMDAVVPSQPHNALSDAAAMRDSVLASVHR